MRSVDPSPSQDVNLTVICAVPSMFCAYVNVSSSSLNDAVTRLGLSLFVTENATGDPAMTFVMEINVGGAFSPTATFPIGSNEGAVQAVAHAPGALHRLSPIVPVLLLHAFAALHEFFPMMPELSLQAWSPLQA
jgi:hypothetical protein